MTMVSILVLQPLLLVLLLIGMIITIISMIWITRVVIVMVKMMPTGLRQGQIQSFLLATGRPPRARQKDATVHGCCRPPSAPAVLPGPERAARESLRDRLLSFGEILNQRSRDVLGCPARDLMLKDSLPRTRVQTQTSSALELFIV